MAGDDIDAERFVEICEAQVERALDSTQAANPDLELEDVGDLYEMVSGFPDETYTLEVELHEYELARLMSSFMEGTTQVQAADEMACRMNLLATFACAAPSHIENIQRLGDLDPDTDDLRGFQ